MSFWYGSGKTCSSSLSRAPIREGRHPVVACFTAQVGRPLPVSGSSATTASNRTSMVKVTRMQTGKWGHRSRYGTGVSTFRAHGHPRYIGFIAHWQASLTIMGSGNEAERNVDVERPLSADTQSGSVSRVHRKSERPQAPSRPTRVVMHRLC